MHGKRVAVLALGPLNSYSLTYDQEAIGDLDPGRTQLSLALPPRAEPYDHEQSRAYVEGLLPQGERREAFADELGLDPEDGFGLIAEVGRDCLGAVTFLPEGEEEFHGADTLAWLDEDELEEVLESPPGRLFDEERPERMRFALPGTRHKLALVRDEVEDRWAWPHPGVPSTHIVKPEPAHLPGIAANELAFSGAYNEIGLPVAFSTLEQIGGVSCFVARRFDRWGEGAGAECQHQESFAQALGIAPDEVGGRLNPGAPTLAEACVLLRLIGEESTAAILLKAAICDLLIGNTKPRGGSVALLYGEGAPMLAPLFDVVTDELYGAVRRRPVVIGVDVPPAPFLIDIGHAIEQCGFEFQPSLIAAIPMMTELCGAVGRLARQAQEQGWYRRAIDDGLLLATRRMTSFAKEIQYLRPSGVD
jgi:serine/threonine-protein kinase HipA